MKKLPDICIPLIGKTKRELHAELDIIIPKQPDLIEWRADFLEQIDNADYVLTVIEEIIERINVPLLFTIRSEREGGEPIPLTEEEKVTLLTNVCSHSAITFIDYEVLNDSADILKVKEAAEANNKQLILSYHNFQSTPKNSELMKQFLRMEMYGAHIAKVAVMPKTKDDVFRLLHLTSEMDELLSISLVTMAMGDLGRYTRLMGWVYGSVMTFGVGVESSAPGQIPIEELRKTIDQTSSII